MSWSGPVFGKGYCRVSCDAPKCTCHLESTPDNMHLLIQETGWKSYISKDLWFCPKHKLSNGRKRRKKV